MAKPRRIKEFLELPYPIIPSSNVAFVQPNDYLEIYSPRVIPSRKARGISNTDKIPYIYAILNLSEDRDNYHSINILVAIYGASEQAATRTVVEKT